MNNKNMLQYANNVTEDKMESVRFITKVVITLICLLGIFTCMICDMAISGAFTWSLYSTSAILFAWLVVIPIFQFKKNKAFMSLVSLSIFILPFLFIIDKIIGDVKFILPMGVPITLVVIAYMWTVYFLLSTKEPIRWNRASLSILLGIPVSLIINFTVGEFIHGPGVDVWDILSCGVLGIMSIVLLFIGKK